MKIPQNNKGMRFGQLVWNALAKEALRINPKLGEGITKRNLEVSDKLFFIPDKQLEKLINKYLEEK